MAGGKRQRGNHGGGRFAKKPKRSKQFWQQRKTVGVAPIPRNESSEEDISSSENEEDNKTHFDKLLSAFSSGMKVIFCSFKTLNLRFLVSFKFNNNFNKTKRAWYNPKLIPLNEGWINIPGEVRGSAKAG